MLPKREYIAKFTDRHIRAVKRSVRSLKRIGFIRVIYSGYNSNCYLINCQPAPVSNEGSPGGADRNGADKSVPW